MKLHSKKFDQVLNEIASGFLYPPSAPLRSVALADFAKATGFSEGDIVQQLFVSTDYFFSHRDKMPQCSRLITFRQSRDQLIAARKLFYFQWWNLLSFRAWDILALALLISAVIVNRKRRERNAPVILFAVSLCVVGTAMMLLNCFLAQLQPRFVLPMMQLLLVSIMILLGVICCIPQLRDEQDELVESEISKSAN